MKYKWLHSAVTGREKLVEEYGTSVIIFAENLADKLEKAINNSNKLNPTKIASQLILTMFEYEGLTGKEIVKALEVLDAYWQHGGEIVKMLKEKIIEVEEESQNKTA